MMWLESYIFYSHGIFLQKSEFLWHLKMIYNNSMRLGHLGTGVYFYAKKGGLYDESYVITANGRKDG